MCGRSAALVGLARDVSINVDSLAAEGPRSSTLMLTLLAGPSGGHPPPKHGLCRGFCSEPCC